MTTKGKKAGRAKPDPIARLKQHKALLRERLEIAVARLEIDYTEGTYDCTCMPGDLCELHAGKRALRVTR